MAHERARPDSLNLTMTVSDVKHRFPMMPAAFLAAATAITLAYGFVPYGNGPYREVRQRQKCKIRARIAPNQPNHPHQPLMPLMPLPHQCGVGARGGVV